MVQFHPEAPYKKMKEVNLMGIRNSVKNLFSTDLESPRMRDYKYGRADIMRRFGR